MVYCNLKRSEKFLHPQACFIWPLNKMCTRSVIMDVILNSEIYKWEIKQNWYDKRKEKSCMIYANVNVHLYLPIVIQSDIGDWTSKKISNNNVLNSWYRKTQSWAIITTNCTFESSKTHKKIQVHHLLC